MNNKNLIFLKKELNKINILFNKGQFNLVVQKCQSLLKKYSNQPIIYNYMGISYLHLNDKNKALEIFLFANQKFSTDASVLCNTGIVYKNLDELKKAKEYFNKALNVNPKHVPSHINLGNLENNLNHGDLAAKHYLNAYKLNNNSEEVLTYYALNLSSRAEFLEAKKIILELSEKFPNNTKSFQLYSKIHKYELNDPHQKLMLSKINFT